MEKNLLTSPPFSPSPLPAPPLHPNFPLPQKISGMQTDARRNFPPNKNQKLEGCNMRKNTFVSRLSELLYKFPTIVF